MDLPGEVSFEELVAERLGSVATWFGCAERPGGGVQSRKLLVRFTESHLRDQVVKFLLLGLRQDEMVVVECPPTVLLVPLKWVVEHQAAVVRGGGCRFGVPFLFDGVPSLQVETYGAGQQDEERYEDCFSFLKRSICVENDADERVVMML